MNNKFPIDQCLESLRCIALLSNEMGCIFALVFDENFYVEGAEGFIEFRVWVRVLLFQGERECEYDRNPS
jgi:hypothetical protein